MRVAVRAVRATYCCVPHCRCMRWRAPRPSARTPPGTAEGTGPTTAGKTDRVFNQIHQIDSAHLNTSTEPLRLFAKWRATPRTRRSRRQREIHYLMRGTVKPTAQLPFMKPPYANGSTVAMVTMRDGDRDPPGRAATSLTSWRLRTSVTGKPEALHDGHRSASRRQRWLRRLLEPRLRARRVVDRGMCRWTCVFI